MKYNDKATDLKPYAKIVKELFYNNHIFYLITFMAIIYVFHCIHKVFLIQLKQKFIIIHVIGTRSFSIDFPRSLLLFQLNHKIESFIYNIVFRRRIDPFYKNNTVVRTYLYRFACNLLKHTIMTSPTILVYFFFICDLCYNFYEFL